jgi:hypothetical protein
MKPFRRVEDRRAGPQALGILVPPGQRTFVILRPRGLPWDLLPFQLEGAVPSRFLFLHFGRDEAARLARQVQAALEEKALDRSNPLEAIPNPTGDGYLVQFQRHSFLWTACVRRPGLPYEPSIFATLQDAAEAAQKIAPIVCPAPDAGQEYYFNTQHFHS